MEQLSLIGPAPSAARTLVDDASGRIVYQPELVPAPECAAWFAALRDGIEWQHERRPMYDRMVDVPRLTAGFDCTGPLPPAIAAAKQLVEARMGLRFNSVGLNFYRDGNDSVAMHNDRTAELLPRSPVALLSLGETRVMRIQSKARPRRAIKLALEAGSLLLMAGAAQEHWEHGIPKTREPVGARISLAFRQRPRANETV